MKPPSPLVIFFSLTISHARNLGQVLETKWNGVVSRLKAGGTLRVGVGLPAINTVDPRYGKTLEILLSACKGHDCYFIAQTPYDKSRLLNYAKDRVNEGNILHFNDGVEEWFQFMRSLDFVVSTRIHGGMAGVANNIPALFIPTDLRILELVNSMKLPFVLLEAVIQNDSVSLATLLAAAKKNFREFETNRLSHLNEYRILLESIGLEMHPDLVDILDPQPRFF